MYSCGNSFTPLNLSPILNSTTIEENDTTEWTFDDIRYLLETTKQALPKEDIINYSNAVHLLDWNKLKFGPYSGKECKNKIFEVTGMMRCHRTLTEILSDAQKFFAIKEKNIANVSTEEDFTIITNPAQSNGTIETKAQSMSVDIVEINDNLSAEEMGHEEREVEALNEIQLQNVSTQICANSVVNDGEQEVVNTTLQNICMHTNLPRVVVNCGDKINIAPVSPKQSPVKKVNTKKKGDKVCMQKQKIQKPEETLKRPLNPFFQYYLMEKDNLKRKYPDLTHNQITSLAGIEFRKLPTSQKEQYMNIYYEQKAIYEQKLSIENNKNKINNKKNLKSLPKQCKEIRSKNKAIAIEPGESERDYLGRMFYANENLGKLVHTKVDEKMKTIKKLWQSLEDNERNGYIDKALRNSYDSRLKLLRKILQMLK